MSPAPIAEVFLRATQIALNSGASEIGMDTLLAALDHDTVPVQSIKLPERSGESFSVASEWIPLSKKVQAALAPLGGFETMTIESLRTALLSAGWQSPE
jgi:hypothetical protein